MTSTTVMGRVPDGTPTGMPPSAGTAARAQGGRPGVPVKRGVNPWIWLLAVVALLAVLGGVAWAFGGASGLFGAAAVDVPNVVYQVHMYTPHSYTHQGVESIAMGCRKNGQKHLNPSLPCAPSCRTRFTTTCCFRS